MVTSREIKLVNYEENRQRELAKLSKEPVIRDSHTETADALAVLVNVAQVLLTDEDALLGIEAELMRAKAEVSA